MPTAASSLCLSLYVLLVVTPQNLSLADVLARAGETVSQLHAGNPVVVADEKCVQILRPYGSTRTDMMGSGALLGQLGTPKVRELQSEFAMVAAPGTDQWLGFRNVVAIDGKRLAPEPDRLAHALSDVSAVGIETARAISAESLRHDLTRAPHEINAPGFALTFLSPERQKRVTFTRKDEKKIDGAAVWVIEFVETGAPLARRLDGTPQPSRGEFWIEAATGRVLRSRVVFDTLDAYADMKLHPERYYDVPRVTVEVAYRQDAKLGAVVPVEMKEAYDSRAEVFTTTVTYSNFRRVEAAPPATR